MTDAITKLPHPDDTQLQEAEQNVARDAMLARAEIESAIAVAQRFPRNEDQAFQMLIRSAKRRTFAEGAEYNWSQGGQAVQGPSAQLMREASRCWGNIRSGFYIVRDDGMNRSIRGWAWDLQTNTREELDYTFPKLIERKDRGWIQPDARELRALTNAEGARVQRNCLRHILPFDLVEEAVLACRETMASKVSDDPEAERRAVIRAFTTLNVPVLELEGYLGHPIGQCNPDELANLRGVYKAIADREAAWSDYYAPLPAEEDEDDESSPIAKAAKAAKVKKAKRTKKPTAKPKEPPKEPEQGTLT